MSNYITIDGGTTNTRVSLISDGNTVAIKKINLGARSSIDDKSALTSALKSAISDILAENGLAESDIIRILASGMITSEFGLCKLDHIPAPAGIKELHDSMHEVVINEVSTIPFVFVRGVKLSGDELCSCDIMRGEETELIGLGALPSSVYILPGSHSKIIYTDKDGRIDRFFTMLTGEMLAALSSSTILKDAVDLSVSKTDTDYLIRGYRYATKDGLNEALFKVRILKNIFGANKEQTYSFYLGAVLSGEINKIVKLNPERIIVGGKEQLKSAICTILEGIFSGDVISVGRDDVDTSVSRGIIKIYNYKA